MKTVKIIRNTVGRSKDLFTGDICELEDGEAILLVAMGKAIEIQGEIDIDLEPNFFEMTLEELGEVKYKSFNKDTLVEYASACGIDTNGMTMDDIYSEIEKVDFSQDED